MNLKTGDLCWAKMKGYPFWPGKIVEAPNSKKNYCLGKKELHRYIYFFGSNNYAWIEVINIQPNSEEMIRKTSQTRFMPLRKAIEQLKNVMAYNSQEILALEEQYYEQGIIKKCLVRMEPLTIDYSKQKESYSFIPNKTMSVALNGNKITEPQKKIPKIHNSFLGFTKNMTNDANGELSNHQEVKPKKFGFIGHGDMGEEIAKNLLKSRSDITVWSQTSMDYNLKDVQQTSDSFSDLIGSCDIILSFIYSEIHVQSFLKGDQGILQSFATHPNKEKGFVLCANVDPQDYVETAASIEASGARFIGASFLGSKAQAMNGELLILCSGDHSLFNDCKTAFMSFQKIRYLGPDLELAPNFHTMIRLFLNSVSKSFGEVACLIEKLKLPLQIFNGLMKAVLDERFLTTLSNGSVEKKFSSDDSIRIFLEELNLETLLAINFPTSSSDVQKKFTE